MAQDPDRPLDDGRVSLPKVDAAMNRRGPSAGRGGKGSKIDKKPVTLRTEEQKTDKDDQKILARAKKRFDRVVDVEGPNRKEAVDDLKHKAGEGQWAADVVAARNLDDRPCITVNKIPTFVNQVVNDERQNRPAINVSPVGDKGDVEVAKMYRGLIRAIERDSVADIAYDTSFESAVSIGWGYIRAMLDYESPGSFKRVITIKRVRNPFTVYLDPAHQEPDGSDARYGFVTEMMPRSEFEDKWPDADPMPWSQAGQGESNKNWISEHEIRVAEYYEIEYKQRRLVLLDNGHEGWWDDLTDEAKKREVIEDDWRDDPTITWYKLTATEILERQEWPGRWIPIVKVTGNEIDIEGKLKLSGLVRNMKSPQQLYNYHRTLSVELASLQPKAPWVGAEGQFEGHEDKWAQAHKKNYPYLEYKVETLDGKVLPPPQRQPFQGAPQAVLQEVQAAAQDMQAVTGIRWDATMQERNYDESGRALRELRRQGDIGTHHYVDNLMRALRHLGQLIVDLIPKVYDQRRMLTILREDDKEEQVMLDPAASKPYEEKRGNTGKALKIFNPTFGRYGVTVTIGPSYATKRIEAAESIMDFLRAIAPAAPQMVAAVVDIIARNQDWPGAEEIAKRLAMMQDPKLLTPEMKDVPPQVQALLQNMKQQLEALGKEKQQLIAALGNQNADRAIKQDSIDKTFEAKILAIIQKAEAEYQKNVGGKLQELGDAANMLIERMSGDQTQMPEGSNV